MIGFKGLIIFAILFAFSVIEVSANPRVKRLAVNPVAVSCQLVGITNNPLDSPNFYNLCRNKANPDGYCQSLCPGGIATCVTGLYCNCTATELQLPDGCFTNSLETNQNSASSDICSAACLSADKPSYACMYPNSTYFTEYACVCPQPNTPSTGLPLGTGNLLNGVVGAVSPLVPYLLQSPLINTLNNILATTNTGVAPAANFVCLSLGPKLAPVANSLSIPTCANYSGLAIINQEASELGIPSPLQTDCQTTLPVAATISATNCVCKTFCPDSTATCDDVGYCSCNDAPDPEWCSPNTPLGPVQGLPDTATLECATLCEEDEDAYQCFYNYCVCVPKATPVTTTTTTTKRPGLGLSGILDATLNIRLG